MLDTLFDSATVDLDFHHVCLLLTEIEFVHLSVSDDTDHVTVVLHALEMGFAIVALVVCLVFLEGFLFGAIPVFVEASTNIVAEML